MRDGYVDEQYAVAIAATLALLQRAAAQPAPVGQTAHLEALLRLQSCINLLECARATLADQLLAAGLDIWSADPPAIRLAGPN